MSRKAAMSAPGCRYDRRLGQQQMDLFSNGFPNGTPGAPMWPELPAEARTALTNLMTQLILEHAQKSRAPSAREVGHDL